MVMINMVISMTSIRLLVKVPNKNTIKNFLKAYHQFSSFFVGGIYLNSTE